MSKSLESRITALEAAAVVAKPTPRHVTKEEAEAAYLRMHAPYPETVCPDDGLTPFERYMRMLDA